MFPAAAARNDRGWAGWMDHLCGEEGVVVRAPGGDSSDDDDVGGQDGQVVVRVQCREVVTAAANIAPPAPPAPPTATPLPTTPAPCAVRRQAAPA
eukprot:gene25761-38813_t